MRGAAWSFVRYLLDRYEDGTDSEAARTRALVQSSAADSRDAVTEVFGVPFDRLATQWSTMLISSDRSEVETSMELQLPSYRMRDVFASRIGEAVNPPSGGYPLLPLKRDLGYESNLDAELFRPHPRGGTRCERRAAAADPQNPLATVRICLLRRTRTGSFGRYE
jgi:hypothetical protein